MIYLITGVLGTGKTAMVVNMLLDNYEGLLKMKAPDGSEIDRPLYFCHIDGLDKAKFKAHELTEEQIQEKPLREIVPEGSVVLVDEADYTYPTRSAAREVPPYVRTLKEIRHQGITLILMTQHPTMIDKYIRNLVGKHIHLERKQFKTKRYEWLRCEENLNSQSFSMAQSEFYQPDEKAFGYYKSASIHTQMKKKKHWAFYAFPIIIMVVIYALFSAKQQISPKKKEEKPVESASAVAAPLPAPVVPAVDVFKQHESASEPVGGKLSDYVERVRNVPESKPIYDGLRQPVNMEYVAGCVQSSKSCNCYTDQGTMLHIDDMVCRAYIKDGIFNKYRPVASADNPVSGRRSSSEGG